MDRLMCAIMFAMLVLGVALGGLFSTFIVDESDITHAREAMAMKDRMDTLRADRIAARREFLDQLMGYDLLLPADEKILRDQLDFEERVHHAVMAAERRVRFMNIAGCTDTAETLLARGLIRPGDVGAFKRGENYCEG